MSKAILIIDMPEVCSNCPINFWNQCGILEHELKHSGRIENPSYSKLDRCPLKSMPERKESYINVEESKDWYEIGYNQCLSEILDR